MNHDNELDPVARLRAADPAGDIEPTAGFAEGVVARSLAESAPEQAALAESTEAEPGAGVGDGAGTPSAVADLSAERTRRRPRWLPYVAVAASLAIVGGTGFGLGAASDRSANLADGASLPISLQAETGTGSSDAAGVPAPDGAGAAIGAQPKVAAGGVADMSYPYGGGRNSFTSSGLSTATGTAVSYAYNARAASTADEAAALAKALGLAAAPELKDGAWTAGPMDGTAPYLTVSPDSTLSFYFTDPLNDPWKCGSDACAQPTNLPSADAAIETLRSLVASLGRDTAAFEFTSDTWEGSFTRAAQAWPVVDGQRLDRPWFIELTDAGIYSASGDLAGLVSLGDYPVVSEQQAFDRLSDPRFGAQMMNIAADMRDQAVASDPASPTAVPTEPPATPTAGTSFSWPVNKVAIVSARLGHASHWQPDGSVLVLPSYEFTDSTGGTWSVIAVADSKLDFSVR